MPNPAKYNNSIAKDNKICVSGSVEGVKIAPRIVATNIMYLQAPNICFADTIFSRPTSI